MKAEDGPGFAGEVDGVENHAGEWGDEVRVGGGVKEGLGKGNDGEGEEDALHQLTLVLSCELGVVRAKAYQCNP